MVRCTVKFGNGDEVTFHRPTMKDAIQHATSKYYYDSSEMYFEEVKDTQEGGDPDG